jgi:hypothetical protein
MLELHLEIYPVCGLLALLRLDYFTMSVVALEDDADANITHFAHRDEFLRLLAKLLEKLDENDERGLDVLVTAMGGIVSTQLSRPLIAA